MQQKSLDWLQAHPEITSLRLAAFDLNGLPRGKRVPRDQAGKAYEGAARMPFSVLNVDIWGEDIANSPLVFDSGDADGVLHPTERGLLPLPWLGSPAAFLPLMLFDEDGAPFMGDPRQVLSAVLKRYEAKALRPVVATELEFYLLDGGDSPAPPTSPQTGRPLSRANVLSISGLDAFDSFFSDLYDACEAMDIPADAAISEAGLGQFEINLNHQDDALKAADDAQFFKMAVRGIARKHGMCASFMAKPYSDQPGNGLHTHFSVLDQQGDNIFDDGTAKGSDALRHAIAKLIETMPASTLLFAPHLNSYRRHENNSHAPTSPVWGYENRTAAIRVPGGSPKARRIEHRVAGGDANPYLMLAVILGAALVGIEEKNAPPPPIKGNGYEATDMVLPGTWDVALRTFANSKTMRNILGATLVDNLVLCKEQEIARFHAEGDASEFLTYVETV